MDNIYMEPGRFERKLNAHNFKGANIVRVFWDFQKRAKRLMQVIAEAEDFDDIVSDPSKLETVCNTVLGYTFVRIRHNVEKVEGDKTPYFDIVPTFPPTNNRAFCTLDVVSLFTWLDGASTTSAILAAGIVDLNDIANEGEPI